MNFSSFQVRCDGCGLPASAEHLRQRVERLELATRFRPIHISVLFIASDPPAKPEDDFYVNPVGQEWSRGLLEALNIPIRAGLALGSMGTTSPGNASGNPALVEFQKRGYYMAYLSECAVGSDAGILEAIGRLTPSLVTRIRFNYKPKHIVVLGSNLNPLIDVLRRANLGSLLVLQNGAPLPGPGGTAGARELRDVFAREIPGLKSVSTV